MNLHLQSHAICFVIFLASILFVIILNALTFMSFVSFRTHIFGDKTLRVLIHLFKLITNRSYLSSTGFKSIRVGLTVHSSEFKNGNFVPKEIVKLNKAKCFYVPDLSIAV